MENNWQAKNRILALFYSGCKQPNPSTFALQR